MDHFDIYTYITYIHSSQPTNQRFHSTVHLHRNNNQTAYNHSDGLSFYMARALNQNHQLYLHKNQEFLTISRERD